ncbi:unnamed protein product, partial [Phaeothamnion confervicola]
PRHRPPLCAFAPPPCRRCGAAGKRRAAAARDCRLPRTRQHKAGGRLRHPARGAADGAISRRLESLRLEDGAGGKSRHGGRPKMHAVTDRHYAMLVDGGRRRRNERTGTARKQDRLEKEKERERERVRKSIGRPLPASRPGRRSAVAGGGGRAGGGAAPSRLEGTAPLPRFAVIALCGGLGK